MLSSHQVHEEVRNMMVQNFLSPGSVSHVILVSNMDEVRHSQVHEHRDVLMFGKVERPLHCSMLWSYMAALSLPKPLQKSLKQQTNIKNMFILDEFLIFRNSLVLSNLLERKKTLGIRPSARRKKLETSSKYNQTTKVTEILVVFRCSQ